MEYEKFRKAVREAFSLKGPWQVEFDWVDDDIPETFDSDEWILLGECEVEKFGLTPEWFDVKNEMNSIELERTEGPFFHLVNISMVALYEFYEQNGWEATLYEIEKNIDQHLLSADKKKTIRYEAKLSEEGKVLFGRLRELRKEVAAERKVPPYVIFMNRTLFEMCERMPLTMEEMLKLYGVGEKNSSLYGERFLEVIREYAQIGEVH